MQELEIINILKENDLSDVEVLKKAKEKKILERVLETKIDEEVYKNIEEVIKNN